MKLSELTDCTESGELEVDDESEGIDYEDETLECLTLMEDMLNVVEPILKDKKQEFRHKEYKKDLRKAAHEMRAYVSQWFDLEEEK